VHRTTFQQRTTEACIYFKLAHEFIIEKVLAQNGKSLSEKKDSVRIT